MSSILISAVFHYQSSLQTIEMIEKEQREAERRPVTKITHKGEIEIENQEPAKAPEALVRLNKLLLCPVVKPHVQVIVKHVSLLFSA